MSHTIHTHTDNRQQCERGKTIGIHLHWIKIVLWEILFPDFLPLSHSFLHTILFIYLYFEKRVPASFFISDEYHKFIWATSEKALILHFCNRWKRMCCHLRSIELKRTLYFGYTIDTFCSHTSHILYNSEIWVIAIYKLDAQLLYMSVSKCHFEQWRHIHWILVIKQSSLILPMMFKSFSFFFISIRTIYEQWLYYNVADVISIEIS